MHRYVVIASLIGSLSWGTPAFAGDNDIVLSRLGLSPNMTDAFGDNLAFRSAISELAIVLAPRIMSPADTLGFGGFQFTVDTGFTSIDSKADYWRMRESSEDPDLTTGLGHGSGFMQTTGIFMRKGMWFPVPSFEVGAGAVHLNDSRIWSGQVYAKFALHEGYHGLPLPSLSLRGAGSRMMGAQDVDLTIVSLDASMSKSFGFGGSINFEPYLGGNLVIIIPRSEVIDKTPQTPDDRRLNFVFRDQDNILRNRIFGGFKLQYYVFALLFEANFALAGTSVDDRGADMECTGADATTSNCNSTDQASAQQTYTISLGMDF